MTASRLRDLWAVVWEAPDSQARDYGREGEIVFARVRLMIIAVIALIPLKSILIERHNTDNWVGLGVALVAVVIGAAVLVLARRRVPPRWLGLASSLLDVSLVSAVNVGFLLAGHPLTATNSQVVFGIYFLTLGGTCLRLDSRICLVAGAAAILEYAAVVLYSARHWNLAGPELAHDRYGTFIWDSQVGRLLLLALATGLAWIIVVRAARHWRESVSDRLTGLPNRRYIEDRLDEAMATARRTRRPLVLALADLDHLKQMNDRHGHAAGDAVLRHAATALRSAFRRTDLIARYGGDEFVILFPEAEPLAAVERLERFRAATAGEPVQLARGSAAGGAEDGGVTGGGGGHAMRITFSLGVAVFPADGEEVDDLLARADERLYAAKRAGRNRLQGP